MTDENVWMCDCSRSSQRPASGSRYATNAKSPNLSNDSNSEMSPGESMRSSKNICVSARITEP